MTKKGVYPHEYKDYCEKFNETSLPEKKKRYCNFRIHACKKSLK